MACSRWSASPTHGSLHLGAANRGQPTCAALLRWLLPLSVGMLVSMTMLASDAHAQQDKGSGTPPKAPEPKAPASPLDPAIELMNKSAQTYQQVQDYTCTLYKQERVKGVLQPENTIFMKFRNQPFSVYMKWFGPQKLNGQEAAYVHGRNNNMMRVKSTGLKAVVGFVSIAPNDPRVLEQTRHLITEAGIGNLIAHCLNSWNKERAFNRTKVTIAEYDFNKRRCYRIEVTMLQHVPQAYSYRSVVFLDKENLLPVRAEVYDWPVAGGSPQGELLEVFSYVNMQFNVGLGDQDFNY